MGTFDHGVGGGLDPGVAGCQQELRIVRIVLAGEALYVGGHARECVGLVILQIDIERKQIAVLAE